MDLKKRPSCSLTQKGGKKGEKISISKNACFPFLAFPPFLIFDAVYRMLAALQNVVTRQLGNREKLAKDNTFFVLTGKKRDFQYNENGSYFNLR